MDTSLLVKALGGFFAIMTRLMGMILAGIAVGMIVAGLAKLLPGLAG